MSWSLNTENYGTRFAPVACTPKELVGMLDYGDRGITSLGLYGEKFKLPPRFHKSLAAELGVPYGIFELFQPEVVMHRAAEVRPDLKLRVTLDRKRGHWNSWNVRARSATNNGYPLKISKPPLQSAGQFRILFNRWNKEVKHG